MGTTNFMRQQAALRAWSVSGATPAGIAIGTGSQAFSVGLVALATEADRKAFTGGSVDIGITNEVTMQGDFNTLEMSGLSLTEFGIFNSATAVTGSAFNAEGFAGVTFNGTTELQVQVTFQTF